MHVSKKCNQSVVQHQYLVYFYIKIVYLVILLLIIIIIIKNESAVQSWESVRTLY